MNIYAKVKDQAAKRLICIGIGAGVGGWTIGGASVALAAIAVVVAAPMVLAVAAFFWTTAAEWTKLGVAELYGTAAQKRMEEAASHDLRESLDAIGQEAFDELERAIGRRDEES
jgi:hypothetical protein